VQPSAANTNETEWKQQKHGKWILIKIIAIALSKPSNKAIFFNNVSVFEEILEGSKTLKIEFTTLFTNFNSY